MRSRNKRISLSSCSIVASSAAGCGAGNLSATSMILRQNLPNLVVFSSDGGSESAKPEVASTPTLGRSDLYSPPFAVADASTSRALGSAATGVVCSVSLVCGFGFDAVPPSQLPRTLPMPPKRSCYQPSSQRLRCLLRWQLALGCSHLA